VELFFGGGNDHQHRITFTGWPLLYITNITEFFSDLFQNFHRNFGVMDFPTPELNADVDLFIIFQPAAGIPDFKIAVMLGGFWAETDFLDLNGLLGFLSLLAFFLLFIEEFAQVHHFADRWFGVGGNLDQIKFCFPRDLQGFLNWNYSSVFPVGINEANFWNPDPVIRPVVYVSYFSLLID
jgi:hypothetical protein